jgi:hypothetical protein
MLVGAMLQEDEMQLPRSVPLRSCWYVLLGGAVAALAVWLAGNIAQGADKGSSMSYREARDYLARHTQLVELVTEEGARVAICPQWQGRVMTSTCGGLDGPSFGFLCRDFIDAGKPDPQFNNYGAEDRMWLSPEGGQFSLWFAPGAKQVFENWRTPPALNEGAFDVVSRPSDPCYRLQRAMKFQNASATPFDLAVTRDVRLLTAEDLQRAFGKQAAARMTQPGVKRVGYETINTIANRGPAMTKEKGLVSIWMLGMLNSSPKTVIVVPYRSGDEAQLGPVVKSDYFGAIPPDRLKVLPEAILFKADAHFRSKIGTSQRRAKNVLGSIDFGAGVLTLVQFTMPEDPSRHNYMNNMWELPQAAPYVGDVANAYNDGPAAPGKKQLGDFYEIESLSPALTLKTGESLTHHHRTIHLQADPATLAQLAKEVLGVEWEKVRQEMGL